MRRVPESSIKARDGLQHEPLRDLRLAISAGVLIQSPRCDLRLGDGPRFIFMRRDMIGVDEVLLALLDRIEGKSGA